MRAALCGIAFVSALACPPPANAQPTDPLSETATSPRAPDPCDPRARTKVQLADALTDSEHVVGHKLLLENDMNSGGRFLSGDQSDRWYTSGIKLVTMLRENTRPTWFSNALPDFACWWGSRYQYQFGYVIGQSIYTPADITNPYPQPNDRYWGAWGYLGAIVQFRDKNDTRTLQTFEFDLGFIGKPALGEPVQKAVHRLIDSPEPLGWDNQLKTEPAVNVTYLGMRKLGRNPRGIPLIGDSLKWDATAHGGFALGNVFDYLNGGLTLRLGNSLAGTPIGTIEVPSLGGGDKWQSGNWYLFLRGDLRATAHNTFLDGSLFRSDPHPSNVKSKTFTYFINRGLTYESSEKNRFTLSFNRRGPEFTVPTGENGAQEFVTLVWEHRFR